MLEPNAQVLAPSLRSRIQLQNGELMVDFEFDGSVRMHAWLCNLMQHCIFFTVAASRMQSCISCDSL